MTRAEATELMNKYSLAAEKAAVARRGSRRRQNYSLEAGMYRTDIINALSGEA